MTKLDYTFDRQITLERIDNIEEGCAKGKIQNMISILCKKANKQKSLEQAAEETEERPEDIRLLYDIVRSFAPDYNEEQIYQAYLEQIKTGIQEVTHES